MSKKIKTASIFSPNTKELLEKDILDNLKYILRGLSVVGKMMQKSDAKLK